MSISIEDFGAHRPWLYHLTARRNVERIRRLRGLESAAHLLRRAGQAERVRDRREESLEVAVENETVSIRDQRPLTSANVHFEDGLDLSDLIELLNRMVFFWPGRDAGPIGNGLRHYQRYADERPAILRVPFAELVAANAGAGPLFCKYNSGSPRCSRGRKSPRSARTFVPPAQASFTLRDVVEVTFRDFVALPASAEIGARPDGPWSPL